MMLLVMLLSFRQSCEEKGVGLDDPFRSLSTWDILWFFDSINDDPEREVENDI